MGYKPVVADVLIIGAGIAGSVCSLISARKGNKVILLSRAKWPNDTNSYHAQGGIIYKGKDDSPQLLVEDIIRAGAGISNPESAEILATEGPKILKNLFVDNLKIPFTSEKEGFFHLTCEAAHSSKRILHADDQTGKAIMEHLKLAIKNEKNITLLENHTAVDIITSSHHSTDYMDKYEKPVCLGAYVFNSENKKVITILSKQTVLATGGTGQLYLHTTNSESARGDGIAMASRSGCVVINMEYIQFHPTAFYKKNAPRFLISESLRGEGARLVTEDGEPFMQRFSPKWQDLAPRDEVARSIQILLLEKNLDCVYLDIKSKMKPDKIRKRFPNIYKTCLNYGVDITKEYIPVVPAAHYTCGGVRVDKWGCTDIERLYAIGEVACNGLHGANRLASTSLLEGLVWGNRSATHINNHKNIDISEFEKKINAWNDEGLESEPDQLLISQDMNSIKNIMWNYVGLIRSQKRLKRAIRDLRTLYYEIDRFYRTTKLNDPLLGLRNQIETGLIISNAAMRNPISRGSHYRLD